MDCAEGYMKKTPEEHTKVIKEVNGCRFCTSWKHTSELCCMLSNFHCLKQKEEGVPNEDSHNSANEPGVQGIQGYED